MSTVFILLLLGIVVGVGTRILDDEKVKGGIVLSTVLGIVGSLVGGVIIKLIIASRFGTLDPLSMFGALIGAIVLVTCQRIFLKTDSESEEAPISEKKEGVKDFASQMSQKVPNVINPLQEKTQDLTQSKGGRAEGNSEVKIPQGTTIKLPDGNEFVTAAESKLMKI